MKNYEINKDTIALIPKNEDSTKIYEKNRFFIINKPVMKIIENSCNAFGSSYYGRHIGTIKLTGITHKTPIIIEESKNIIYFPTTSPRLKTCCWLSLNNIKNYKKNDKNTIIYFCNGKKIELNISINSFDNQYLRATKLESILRRKINNI